MTGSVLIAIDPLPASISGLNSVCIGSLTALSNATSGGAWSSSNTAIATVSGAGVATGVSAGSATITYTLPTGCYTTMAVYVYDAASTCPCAAFGGSFSTIGNSGTINASIGAGNYYIDNDVTVNRHH
jgi:uncharacterized protein YjdB